MKPLFQRVIRIAGLSSITCLTILPVALHAQHQTLVRREQAKDQEKSDSKSKMDEPKRKVHGPSTQVGPHRRVHDGGRHVRRHPRRDMAGPQAAALALVVGGNAAGDACGREVNRARDAKRDERLAAKVPVRGGREFARRVSSGSWDFGSRRSVIRLRVRMHETKARDGENDGEAPPDSIGFAKVGID
jgi:hypothetical protein